LSKNFFRIKTIDGVVWLNFLGIVVGILGLIQLSVSARILGPDEIALISIFFLVQGVLVASSEIGLNKAIIQRQKVVKEHIDTVFTVNLIRGTLLFLLINSFQNQILLFFDFVEAGMYFTPLSVVFLLQGIRNPAVLYFQRRLNFKIYAIWQSAASIAKVVVVVSLVLIFESVWGMVVGVLVHELTLLILSYTLTKVRPKLRFSYSKFFELFSYGKWVLLSTLIMLLDRQGAQFITAKILEPEYLALLYVSLQISKVSQMMVGQIKNTLFPVFSRLNSKQDITEFSKYLDKSSQSVLIFLFPLVGFVYLLEDSIIQIFLGSEWKELGSILFLIFLSHSIESFNSISIAAFNAMGKPKVVFYINILRASTLFLLGILFVELYGLAGIGYAFVVKSTLSLILSRIFLSSSTQLVIAHIFLAKYPLFHLLITIGLFILLGNVVREWLELGPLYEVALYVVCATSSWMVLDRFSTSFLGDSLTLTKLVNLIKGKILKEG